MTVAADAGMMSEANLADIEDAGWSFVVGGKLPAIPYAVKQWRADNPDREPPDGLVLTQPTIMGPRAHQRRRTTFNQYKTDRARRSLHGIEQQVAKAEKAAAGQAAIKRNRFVSLTGGTRAVNRDLEAKARALAGWKPYVTNIDGVDPARVIGAYHQLWRIEHAFRMSKHDLRARPIFHHKREPSTPTSRSCSLPWPSRTASRSRPAGPSRNSSARYVATAPSRSIPAATLTAEDPLPADIREALAAIHQGAH